MPSYLSLVSGFSRIYLLNFFFLFLVQIGQDPAIICLRTPRGWYFMADCDWWKVHILESSYTTAVHRLPYTEGKVSGSSFVE